MSLFVDVRGDLLGMDIRGLSIPQSSPVVDALTLYDGNTQWNVDTTATQFDGTTKDFAGKTFGYYDLGRTVKSLDGVDFSGTGAKFQGTILREMKFTRCTFDERSFTQLDNTTIQCTIENCTFSRCTFYSSTFPHSTFQNATFHDCIFNGADLSAVDTSTSTFRRCVYDNATLFLGGTVPSGFNLDPKLRTATATWDGSETTLTIATTDDAIPFALNAGATVTVGTEEAYTTEAVTANWRTVKVNTEFSGTVFIRLSVPCLPYEDYTWLGNIPLSEPNTFADADAHGSIFKDVDFGTTDLSGCTLDRCDLRGADLSGTTMDANTTVLRAVYDNTTQWPAGFDKTGAFNVSTDTVVQHIPDTGISDWPGYAGLTVANTISRATMESGTNWNLLDLRHQIYTASNPMRGTDVRGADLRGASLPNAAQWRMVLYNNNTQWPGSTPTENIAKSSESLYGKDFTLVTMTEWDKALVSVSEHWKGSIQAGSGKTDTIHPGADLSGKTFEKEIVVKDATDLTGMNLTNCTLHMKATGVDFTNMTTDYQTVLKGEFTTCDFTGVSFDNVTLGKDVVFRGCNFTNATFSKATLNMTMEDCTMTGATFNGAILGDDFDYSGTTFPLSQLKQPVNAKAVFTSVSFGNVPDVVIHHVTFDTCTFVDLKEASLRDCVCQDCSFNNADLRHADLNFKGEDNFENDVTGAKFDNETRVHASCGFVNIGSAIYCTNDDPVVALTGIQKPYADFGDIHSAKKTVGATEATEDKAVPIDLEHLEMDDSNFRNVNFVHCNLSDALLSSDPTQLENSYYDNRTQWPTTTMHDDIPLAEQMQYMINLDDASTYNARTVNGLRIPRDLCGVNLSGVTPASIPADLSECIIDAETEFPAEKDSTSAIFVSTEAKSRKINVDGEDYSSIDFRQTNRGNPTGMATAIPINDDKYGIIATRAWAKQATSFTMREVVVPQSPSVRIQDARVVRKTANASRIGSIELDMDTTNFAAGSQIAIVTVFGESKCFEIITRKVGTLSVDISKDEEAFALKVAGYPHLYFASPVYAWNTDTEVYVACLDASNKVVKQDHTVKENTGEEKREVTNVSVNGGVYTFTCSSITYTQNVDVSMKDVNGDRVRIGKTSGDDQTDSTTLTMIHQNLFEERSLVVKTGEGDIIEGMYETTIHKCSWDPETREVTINEPNPPTLWPGHRLYLGNMFLGAVSSVAGNVATLDALNPATIYVEKDNFEDESFTIADAGARVNDDELVVNVACDNIPRKNRQDCYTIVRVVDAESAAPTAEEKYDVVSIAYLKENHVTVTLDGNDDLEVGRMVCLYDNGSELGPTLSYKTGRITAAVAGSFTLEVVGVNPETNVDVENVSAIMDAYSLKAMVGDDPHKHATLTGTNSMQITIKAGRYSMSDVHVMLMKDSVKQGDAAFVCNVAYEPDVEHPISFERCSANGTDFTGAEIRGVCFDCADIRGANFTGCEARREDFENVIVDTSTILPFFINGPPSNTITFDAEDNRLKNASLINMDLSSIEMAELDAQPFESCVYFPGLTVWPRKADGNPMTDEEIDAAEYKGLVKLGERKPETNELDFEFTDLSGLDFTTIKNVVLDTIKDAKKEKEGYTDKHYAGFGAKEKIEELLDFSESHCLGADFSDCIFREEADFDDSDLRGCTFAFAQNLDRAAFEGCFFDETTVFPFHSVYLNGDLNVCTKSGALANVYSPRILCRGSHQFDLTRASSAPTVDESKAGVTTTYILREDVNDTPEYVDAAAFAAAWTGLTVTANVNQQSVVQFDESASAYAEVGEAMFLHETFVGHVASIDNSHITFTAPVTLTAGQVLTKYSAKRIQVRIGLDAVDGAHTLLTLGANTFETYMYNNYTVDSKIPLVTNDDETISIDGMQNLSGRNLSTIAPFVSDWGSSIVSSSIYSFCPTSVLSSFLTLDNGTKWRLYQENTKIVTLDFENTLPLVYANFDNDAGKVTYTYTIYASECYREPVLDLADVNTILATEATEAMRVNGTVTADTVESMEGAMEDVYEVTIHIPSKRHELERGYVKIDLSKVSLTLYGISTDGTHLPPVELTGKPVEWTGCVGSNYTGKDMQNLRVNMAFSGTQLHNADLRNSAFNYLSFLNCDLRGCDLTGITPVNALLSKCMDATKYEEKMTVVAPVIVSPTGELVALRVVNDEGKTKYVTTGYPYRKTNKSNFEGLGDPAVDGEGYVKLSDEINMAGYTWRDSEGFLCDLIVDLTVHHSGYYVPGLVGVNHVRLIAPTRILKGCYADQDTKGLYPECGVTYSGGATAMQPSPADLPSGMGWKYKNESLIGSNLTTGADVENCIVDSNYFVGDLSNDIASLSYDISSFTVDTSGATNRTAILLGKTLGGDAYVQCTIVDVFHDGKFATKIPEIQLQDTNGPVSTVRADDPLVRPLPTKIQVNAMPAGILNSGTLTLNSVEDVEYTRIEDNYFCGIIRKNPREHLQGVDVTVEGSTATLTNTVPQGTYVIRVFKVKINGAYDEATLEWNVGGSQTAVSTASYVVARSENQQFVQFNVPLPEERKMYNNKFKYEFGTLTLDSTTIVEDTDFSVFAGGLILAKLGGTLEHVQ